MGLVSLTSNAECSATTGFGMTLELVDMKWKRRKGPERPQAARAWCILLYLPLITFQLASSLFGMCVMRMQRERDRHTLSLLFQLPRRKK